MTSSNLTYWQFLGMGLSETTVKHLIDEVLMPAVKAHLRSHSSPEPEDDCC